MPAAPIGVEMALVVIVLVAVAWTSMLVDWLTLPVARSKMATCVTVLVMSNVIGAAAARVSSLLLGRRTADTGTIGNEMVGLGGA